MRLALPPPAWLRALCLAGFAAMLVQIFLLDHSTLVLTIRDALWDKLLHATAYGALAFLLWAGIGFAAPWLSWAAILAIGALDEVHQIYVPTRTADILDVVADAIGAAIVILALHHAAKRKAHRGQSVGVDRLRSRRAFLAR